MSAGRVASASPAAEPGDCCGQSVRPLLSRDESEVLEFKSWPASHLDGPSEPAKMEEKTARALCGLVNTKGGHLLIGVGDDGKAEGLARAGGRLSRKERDEMLAWVTNVIVDYLGAEHDGRFCREIVEVDGRDILCCAVDASEDGPIVLKKRLDGKHDFFVRAGSTSRPLNSKEMLEYIKTRWPDWGDRPSHAGNHNAKTKHILSYTHPARRRLVPGVSGADGDVDATAGPAKHDGDIDAFLSYSHDAKDSVAKPLVRGLEQRGVTVWWDSTAMRISDNLKHEIGEGIARARHGVVIVSRGYLDSGWGKTELGAMFGKKMQVFPILYGVSTEEAQKSLPAISGTLMRAWDDSPESVMDEIASAVRDSRSGQASRKNATASAARDATGRAHNAREGGGPMPDGPELQSSAPRVDWDRLRPGTDVRKSFEDLCCFLAEREPAPDGSKFKRLAPPDGGVECLRCLPDEQEWGWQAKYFRTAPNSGQWRQIDESVRSALKSNPRLTRYIVCAPSDRTKAGAAKWSRLVEQWRATKPIAYEYWGRHELESRLIDDKNHDLLKYYFDKEFLSAEWAKQTVLAAIADAGPRHTPKQNVDLPIGKRFQALCGAEAFFSRLDDVAASMRDHLSAAPTRPTLDAVGNDFAKLKNTTDDIAALLTDHAAHKKGGIPAAQIRKKSHEAKVIISDIASRLADEDRKRGPTEAGQHHERGVFDTEQHRLQWLYDDLDELTGGQLSEDMDIHKTGALLVVGNAGVGKTHLFCDVAKGRTARKEIAILLHGSHFYGGPPKEAIIKNLDLGCRFSDLLEGLNLAGQLAGSRSLLMIDALNEGAGKDMWKRHLGGLLQEIARFPHVALALSVRKPYEPEVIPDSIVETALRRIIHPGFGSRTEAALAMFFDSNGIERPAVPFMAPEFSNPQFLTVLCRALKNKGYIGTLNDFVINNFETHIMHPH